MREANASKNRDQLKHVMLERSGLCNDIMIFPDALGNYFYVIIIITTIGKCTIARNSARVAANIHSDFQSVIILDSTEILSGSSPERLDSIIINNFINSIIIIIIQARSCTRVTVFLNHCKSLQLVSRVTPTLVSSFTRTIDSVMPPTSILMKHFVLPRRLDEEIASNSRFDEISFLWNVERSRTSIEKAGSPWRPTIFNAAQTCVLQVLFGRVLICWTALQKLASFENCEIENDNRCKSCWETFCSREQDCNDIILSFF